MFYWALYPLQDKVQEEIDQVIGQTRRPTMANKPNLPYTDAVIHEIQRIGNIVPLNGLRMAAKDTTLGGYFIPKVHLPTSKKNKANGTDHGNSKMLYIDIYIYILIFSNVFDPISLLRGPIYLKLTLHIHKYFLTKMHVSSLSINSQKWEKWFPSSKCLGSDNCATLVTKPPASAAWCG